MLLLGLSLVLVAAQSSYITVFVDQDLKITFVDKLEYGGCAQAEYIDNVDTNGWGELTVRGQHDCAAGDSGQALAMGFAEGYLTSERIYQAFVNFNASNGYLVGGFLPPILQNFVSAQTTWMQQQQQQAPPQQREFWQHVNALLQQARGVGLGYQANSPSNQSLTLDQVYILAMAGDLEDLSAAIPYLHGSQRDEEVKEKSEKKPETPIPIHMDCSGLVKIQQNYEDLFVGHTTFNAYWCMLRVFKHYMTDFNNIPTSASTISFSSRPGDLESKDDFFLLNSKMVVIETSLSIFNKSLYYLLNNQTVPTWIRCQVANRLARTGSEWIQLFSMFNSGTHNNEWIVVDYNYFEIGSKPSFGVAYLLDQIPGLINSMDATNLLTEQGYIPSYNIPYFPNIFEISGYAAAGYSYYNDTRAQIFRRNQSGVGNLTTMSNLMNKNDYQNDPLAEGNPCNQISARCDLAPGSAASAFGGIDSKNVDLAHVYSQQVYAIGAPSHVYEPVFVFTPEFEGVSHVGMPITWDFNWTTMTPANF